MDPSTPPSIREWDVLVSYRLTFSYFYFPFALPDETVLLQLGASYPEGNFGGNQLLDGSISLSPLYLALTIDLHVRIVADLHQGFP